MLKRIVFVSACMYVASLVTVSDASAKLAVVTTTTDLAAIAAEILGQEGSAESIARGTQDPHSIEAKPSYMIKVSKADLVIAVGMDLEIGWLPSILRGARNPGVLPGRDGYLEVGPSVEAIEVPKGELSRAQGDVHPFGNPHVLLDPIRAAQIAVVIAERFAAFDSAHGAQYRARAASLRARLEEKTKDWQGQMKRSGVGKVVTYHKTLNYFLSRFGIELVAILEPKPGIPPTSGHIIEVTRKVREQKVSVLLIENYFDPSVGRKLTSEVPELSIRTVPVAVGGAPGVDSLDSLYEALVRAIVEKGPK